MIVSTDTERTMIGMCLSSSENLELAAKAGIDSDAFEDRVYGLIWSTMLSSTSGDVSALLSDVCSSLPSHRQAIFEALESAPIAQNFEPYLEEVQALARMREARAEISGLKAWLDARAPFEPVGEIETRLESTFERLQRGGKSQRRGPLKIDEAIEQLVPEIEQRIEALSKGVSAGISTGFAPLDLITGGGFGRGTINVAAARTGMGKTTLAVNFLHTAAVAGYRCAYFTVEMLSTEILQKLLSLAAKVNQTKLRLGDLSEGDLDGIAAAVRTLHDKPIWFDDTTKASFEAMERQVRRLHRQGGLDLIVIDYIQQFHLEQHYRSTQERITAVSHRLKQLANELKIAVVALAQLNRDAEKDQQLPDIHHIKDSGAIEQDSDLILLIHNKGPDTRIYVGKNRNGRAKCSFPVDANLAFNSFKNMNLNLEVFSD